MRVISCTEYLKEAVSELEMHYYSFDWDDNILHMPTKILMDKKTAEGWSPVDVSTSDFAKLRHDKDNYRLRNDDPVVAFSEFRDTGARGADAFYQDSLTAIKSGKRGPSWNAFLRCLTEAAIFSIITARGHEPESMRRVVEWIIDNVLDEDQKFTMYARLLKFVHFYTPHDADSYDRIYRGMLSQTPLVTQYLDNCDFYGVSSQAFANEFGQGSALNPERAKQQALETFVRKCNDLGKKIGAKSVSVGFSDDDPKNVEHIQKFFGEKSSEMAKALEHELKLNVYDTRDPQVQGGTRTKYTGAKSVIDATSHLDEATTSWGTGTVAPGMESSVLPFTKWSNMTQELYPKGPDNSKDDFHNSMRNKVGLVGHLTGKKSLRKNEKDKKIRGIRKGELRGRK
jgi:hypothetical protein